MYTAPQKKFGVRDESEIMESIRQVGDQFAEHVQRVFLGDGDAMVLSTRRLMKLLQAIKDQLPRVRRISSYCLPRNIRNKSLAELEELRQAGLSLVYIGAESGDDEVLQKVNKGETFESTREALHKLGQAGVVRSVMLLNGLGGRQHSEQHARNSARLANQTQPEFLATLVVSFPQGEERFRSSYPEWNPLDQQGLFLEMVQFLQELDLKRTVFRSDHASNWLILKGTLGAEKERLLQEVRMAVQRPDSAKIRPAWQRGL